MNIDFVQRVKLRLKQMSRYGSGPVILTTEAEAVALELGGAINAQAGDVAELHDKLDRYKGAVLEEFMGLCNQVTALEVMVGQLRTQLKSRPSYVCDPEAPGARNDWA